MRTRSKALFKLIHSLSKEEKVYLLRNYFPQRSTGKNILRQIFQAISKSGNYTYDEQQLGKAIPHIAARKKELYETILDGLAQRQKKIPFLNMIQRIRYAALLSYRLLFDETLEMLAEVEAIAKEENQIYILGTLLQYKTIFLNPAFRNKVTLDWKKVGDEFISNSNYIQQVANIYIRFIEINTTLQSNVLVRSHAERDRIGRFIHDPFLNSSPAALSPPHQCFFYITKFFYNRLLARYNKGLESMEQCGKVIFRNRHFFEQRRPIEFIYLYSAYVSAHLDAKALKRLQKLLPEFKRTIDASYSKHEYSKSKYQCYLLRYQYLLHGSNIREESIIDAENYYEKKKDNLLIENRLELEMMLMIACFAMEDYSKADDYQVHLANEKNGKMRQETFDMARIMGWLILWEKKDYNELQEQFEKFQRLLGKKGKEGYLFEQILIKHLKKMIKNIRERKSIVPLLNSLKKEWISLSKKDDLCANYFLGQFDFLSWIDKKIEQKILR